MSTKALAVLAVLCVLGLPAAADPKPSPRPGATHAVPLYGHLARHYDAPDDPFGPGHRGIDVGAPAGTPVHASGWGTVTFAGVVAGNRTVTVNHGGGVRTTYSYLGSSAVRAGQWVQRGTPIGTVGDGHPGAGFGPHVHLSVRRDGVYEDPLGLYVGSAYSDLLELVG